MTRRIFYLVFLLSFIAASLSAQSAVRSLPQAPASPDAELKFVVYVSRHGVRSPTGKPEQYNPYSTAAGHMECCPGYLTEHGYQLMKLFGAYDRMELSSQGLLKPDWLRGCGPCHHLCRLRPAHPRNRQGARRRSLSWLHHAGASSGGRCAGPALSCTARRRRSAGRRLGCRCALRTHWR